MGSRWTVLALLFQACSPAGQSDDRAADTTAAPAARATREAASRCYEARRSMLGRAPGASGARDSMRGWLRLDAAAAGSPAPTGPALLVDADGASLGAEWKSAGDSTLVTGFDDFLRVEVRLAANETAAAGTAVATSDADFERDSAGRVKDFRREWAVSARRAPCDSMPRPWRERPPAR